MGSIFGKGSVAEPTYKLLQSEPIEIRQYSPYVLAEVKMICDAKNECDTDAAFKILTKYIGLSGTAANEGKKSMAMTAPVTITPVKMAMTAPVVQTN